MDSQKCATAAGNGIAKKPIPAFASGTRVEVVATDENYVDLTNAEEDVEEVEDEVDDKGDTETESAHPPSGLNELEEHINDLGEPWETESLFEDIIEDLAEDRFFTDG